MLAFALGIGIISYFLFGIGILGLLNGFTLGFTGILAVVFCAVLILKYQVFYFLRQGIRDIINEDSLLIKVCSLFIASLVLINFIIALSPERAFDALWYHLVIPQVYLQQGVISYIPGSLLYYSVMPKLVDLLFMIPLAFDWDMGTRLISFGFGVFCLYITYCISRLFLDKKYSYFVIILLLSNFVFSWQMTTAYIDMGRAFFETLSFYTILQWMKNKNSALFVESALCLGLASATKIISLSSILPMLVMLYSYFKDKEPAGKIFKYLLSYVGIVMLVIAPWLLFAFVNTGNPIFPFFSDYYSVGISSSVINPINFVHSVWGIFVTNPDRVSPLYLILFPLVILFYQQYSRFEKKLVLYCLFALFAWYLIPNTGGGRFILPYLPVFSVLFFITLKKIDDVFIKRLLISILILISIATFFMRLYPAGKVTPVVLGLISKQQYLANNLNFNYGDFYDTDGKLAEILNNQDIVLIYGVHNLHYAKFNYIHESWLKKGDIFNYILVQDGMLPDEFYFFKKIYNNPQTNVSLYYGGGFWEY